MGDNEQRGAQPRMRKASRQMDAAFALEVLDKAPYVTVSFTRQDGNPYGNSCSTSTDLDRRSRKQVLNPVLT